MRYGLSNFYNKMNKKNLFIAFVSLIAIAVIGRLSPHLWNATPLAAVALFSASYFGLRFSALATIASLAISDLAIGTYDWRIMAVVYSSFLVAAAIGKLTSRRRTPITVAGAVLGSSVFFFIATNFAVWAFGTMYQHTLSGLLDAYVAALPFFRNSVLGDALYALALFGGYEAVVRAVSVVKKTKIASV